jgi:hypothetical protein
MEEHIAPIVNRALANAGNGKATPPATPQTLPELVSRLTAIEGRENPDVVVERKALRMTSAGFLEVPSLTGEFALTDWARASLASMLGIRWHRYAENASDIELADEVNRRLARAAGEVRVRSTRDAGDFTAHGTIRAFVSPGYTSVADSRLAWMLGELLASEEQVKVERFHVTDMTTTYALSLGSPLNPKRGSEVGDVQASILIQNSGVGYASLFLSLSLLRLICLNGMTIQDGASARRAHRGLDDARLRSLLGTSLGNIGSRVRAAADNLVLATERPLRMSVEDVVTRLLIAAHLPKRLLPEIQAAYDQEPHPSVFGVSQALTAAARTQTPELRVELENLAGRYLALPN